MPRYSYEVLTADCKTVRGMIEGGSSSEAAAVLRRQGLIITGLKEQPLEERGSSGGSSAASFGAGDLLIYLSRVTPADVVLLLRQMAALITAGVSVIITLSVLENQSQNRRLRYMLSSIRREVEAGNALSDAMRQFPKTFTTMVTSILKTGETSGLLDTAMEQVSTYLEERMALVRQVISSTAYPAMVLVSCIGLVIFLASYVIPRITPFLQITGGTLPWNARMLIYVSQHFSTHMARIGTGFGILALIGALLYYLPGGRYVIDRYSMRLPMIGSIIQYTLIVHFAKTLYMLINSGVSILEGLTSTRDTIRNTAVRRAIDQMIESVLYGESLSDPLLRSSHVFPPMVGNIVKVREETGSLDAALLLVADVYDKMLQERIRRLTAMIEPVLIIMLGGIVAFVASTLIGSILASYGRYA